MDMHVALVSGQGAVDMHVALVSGQGAVDMHVALVSGEGAVDKHVALVSGQNTVGVFRMAYHHNSFHTALIHKTHCCTPIAVL